MSAPRTLQVITRIGSLAALVSAATALAQTNPQLRDELWVTNGTVHASTSSGNTIYVGGSFTRVGPAVGNAAAIDLATGAVLAPYPRVDGIVRCVAPDGAGGWFLGGDFKHIQGVPRAGLARIDASGNVTPWDPAPQGEPGETYDGVHSLLVANGTLYVTGSFVQMGDFGAIYTAAFNTANGWMRQWNPRPSGYVTKLAAGLNRIYMSGDFDSVEGQPRAGIAAVDPVTGDCLPWTSPVTGNILMAWAGSLYMSTSSGHLVGINESSGQWVLSMPITGAIAAAVGDPTTGTIYLGGGFSSINGVARGNLAAIDASGVLTPWNPGANGDITDMALDSGVVVAGGFFTTLGGQLRPFLASVGTQSGVVTAWNPRLSNPVMTLRASNGIVYAGGHFTSVNSIPRRNAAALDASTGTALPWNPDPNGEVLCMTTGSGVVYMGGRFSQVGQMPRIHFACVNSVTGAPTPWAANMTAGDPEAPLTMTLFGNTLFTGGTFESIGGVTRPYLAAIDAATGAILPWNPSPNGAVRTMEAMPTLGALPDMLYVGGSFTSIGGVSRNYLASIELATGIVGFWNPSPNNTVYTLAIARDHTGFPEAVCFGGAFTKMMFDIPRNRAAAASPAGGLWTWNPDANGTVHTIVTTEGQMVYLGGQFTTLGGQPRKYIGAVNTFPGTPLDWAPQVESDGSSASGVYTMLRLRNTVYAGGTFLSTQGESRTYFTGYLDGMMTGVEPDASPPTPSVLRAAPNPFGASTVARFTLSRAEIADVAVYDVAGRRVQQLHRGMLAEGPHAMPWNGSDDAGRSMPSGIYFLRVTGSSVELSVKLHRLR